MKKTCSKCGNEKDFENEFGKNKNTKDGKNCWCKQCVNAGGKSYYSRNTDLVKEKALAVHHVKQDSEEYRERRKEYQKQYNKDYMNRPETKEKIKTWIKRYHSKPHIRVSRRMSFQVWFTLKDKLTGVNKKACNHWEDLVGYKLADLVKHLESQFKNGMNWDNYGKGGWDIDHRTPKSWFDIKEAGDLEFQKCWALENLQPKWHIENSSKGARYAD